MDRRNFQDAGSFITNFSKMKGNTIPNQLNAWTKAVTIVHENVVLVFNKEDAQIARNWSKFEHSQTKPAEMYNLRGLREEHAQLIRIADRLSKVVARNAPPPRTELFALRHELISAVIRHLKAEDWVLYPRLFVSIDSRVAQTARSFSEEMGGLAKEFTAYAQYWGSFAIEDDWAGYRLDTNRIIGDLTQRITRENTDLYPLLAALNEVS